MAYGTEAQKERFLRPMLRGDEIWCQGFSEPDAGSDLASLTTRGRRLRRRRLGHQRAEGLEHVRPARPTGVSCWPAPTRPRPSTRASRASWSTCRLPGIEVRPLRTATGDADFCEIFFDDVRIGRRRTARPRATRVGRWRWRRSRSSAAASPTCTSRTRRLIRRADRGSPRSRARPTTPSPARNWPTLWSAGETPAAAVRAGHRAGPSGARPPGPSRA